ncbi:hypothetical protein B0H11DRAFT_2203513 [Mycena galericulata]|nr:hypothetical protein B0H11DRAFT_2203513 [Mycena galericulata]
MDHWMRQSFLFLDNATSQAVALLYPVIILSSQKSAFNLMGFLATQLIFSFEQSKKGQPISFLLQLFTASVSWKLGYGVAPSSGRKPPHWMPFRMYCYRSLPWFWCICKEGSTRRHVVSALFDGYCITHLEALGSASEREPAWPAIAWIPNLTHLAFCDPAFYPIFASDAVPTAIFLYADELQMEEVPEDPRFVVSSKVDFDADWQDGAKGGGDYWAHGDRFLEAAVTKGRF